MIVMMIDQFKFYMKNYIAIIFMLFRNFAFGDDTFKSLLNLFKHRNSFSIGKVRKIGSSSVVILHSSLGDDVSGVKDGVRSNVLNTENHIAA